MNTRSKEYNVLIVGAGKIGAFYDVPADDKVLSHAHAVTINERLRLVGFVDVDFSKACQAAELWGGCAFSSLHEVKEEIDIVCCATFDKAHCETIKQIMEINPKAIVVEKPFTETYDQAEEIYNLLKHKEIIVEVNYSRRFIEAFNYMKYRIQQMGRLLCGNAFYGKGLLHKGSHLIDLFLFLFLDVCLVKRKERFSDYNEADKSYVVIAEVDDAEIYVQPVDSRTVTVFEMDLLFENGRVRYSDENNRIEIFSKCESSIYAGEINYQLDKEIIIDNSKALTNLYDNIVNALENNGNTMSSMEDVLKVMRLCT